LVIPLLPFIRDEFSLDYAQSGLVLSVFAISYGIGQLPAGWLADRIGPIALILIGTLGVAVADVRSRLDKATEQAPIGYYAAHLTDYDIKAELTSTTRCGLHRYTFPKNAQGRVLVDLQFGAEYALQIRRIEIRQADKHRIEGLSTYHSQCWGAEGLQDYTVHFVVEFDQPIQSFAVPSLGSSSCS